MLTYHKLNPAIKEQRRQARQERKEKRLAYILELKNKGMTNAEIADKLFLQPGTINAALNNRKDPFYFVVDVTVEAYSEEEARTLLAKRLSKDYIKHNIYKLD